MTVVRDAVGELKRACDVYSMPGKGVYVADPAADPHQTRPVSDDLVRVHQEGWARFTDAMTTAMTTAVRQPAETIVKAIRDREP